LRAHRSTDNARVVRMASITLTLLIVVAVGRRIGHHPPLSQVPPKACVPLPTRRRETDDDRKITMCNPSPLGLLLRADKLRQMSIFRSTPMKWERFHCAMTLFRRGPSASGCHALLSDLPYSRRSRKRVGCRTPLRTTGVVVDVCAQRCRPIRWSAYRTSPCETPWSGLTIRHIHNAHSEVSTRGRPGHHLVDTTMCRVLSRDRGDS